MNSFKIPSARDLLMELGIGGFNATGVIVYMQIAPATCDPKSVHVTLLVEAVQKALFEMGFTDVPLSGRLDAPTASALAKVVGPDWERLVWSTNIERLVRAKREGYRKPAKPRSERPVVMSMGGPLDFLPDVPGGLLTYGAAAYLLYRYVWSAK